MDWSARSSVRGPSSNTWRNKRQRTAARHKPLTITNVESCLSGSGEVSLSDTHEHLRKFSVVSLPLTYQRPESTNSTSKLIKVVEAQFPRVEAGVRKVICLSRTKTHQQPASIFNKWASNVLYDGRIQHQLCNHGEPRSDTRLRKHC